MEIMPPDPGNRDPQTGTLIRLRGLYPSLKTALRKVADVILREPEMAIYASVNEVAAVATVSEATVMRFCRILGFKGFQDFKIALARQILVIGVGGSGPAVTYTGNRFLLLGLRAFMCTDFYLMLMAVSQLSRGDVVLAISNLGTTREIVETVGIAREKQARIMCITNNSLSPLARISNPVLVTASREVTLPEEAVASLVCQITILDALFALIASAQGGQSQETLQGMEEALVKVGVMRQPAK